MSAAATPWMKFYPQDWRADEKLRLCSLAARGLWVEMLALMHRSERYGQLLIGGRVPTDAQLAVQVGASSPEVTELLGELEAAGVFSRAASGAIYSRRMTRDHKKAQIARKNGKNGGNPNLSKQKGNPASVKGEDKGRDKPHIPEARGQSSDTDVSGQSPPDPIKQVFDLGVSLFVEAGSTPSAARSLVAKCRKQHGDGATFEALNEARQRGITDPKAWVPAFLAKRAAPKTDFYAAIDRKYGT